MFDVGRLKDGDTVVISGAAGSVGLVSPLPTPSPDQNQNHIAAWPVSEMPDELTLGRSHVKSPWLIRNVKSSH